jgi:hypothetical protein
MAACSGYSRRFREKVTPITVSSNFVAIPPRIQEVVKSMSDCKVIRRTMTAHWVVIQWNFRDLSFLKLASLALAEVLDFRGNRLCHAIQNGRDSIPMSKTQFKNIYQ